MRKLFVLLLILMMGSFCRADGITQRVRSSSIVDKALQNRHFSENAALTAGGLNFTPGVRLVAGFQDDETWTVTGTGATVAADTNTYKYGDRSLKIFDPCTCTKATVSCTLPFPITLRSGVGFWIKTDDVSRLTTITINVYDPNGTSYHQFVRSTSGYPNLATNNTWQLIWIPKRYGDGVWYESGNPAQWGTAAVPTVSCPKISFEFVTTVGDVNIWLGSVLTQDFDKTAIIVGVDGAYSTAYTKVFQDMKARGWKGVVWQVAEFMGTPGWATIAQINEMYSAHWDICSHLYTGILLTDSNSTAFVRSDIERSIKTLHNNGWYRGSQFCSWMGNAGFSAVDPITGEKAGDLAERYFLGARGYSKVNIPEHKRDGISVFWYGEKGTLWIPPNWYNLPYVSTYGVSATDFAAVGGLKDKIDLAIAMHWVLNTYTHRVVDSPTGDETGTQLWNDFISYLDQKVASGEIEVITMTEWYDRIKGRNGAYYFGDDGLPHLNSDNPLKALEENSNSYGLARKLGWNNWTFDVNGYVTNAYAAAMDQNVVINAEPNFGVTNMHGNISRFTNDAGYLIAYSETDPCFAISSAHNITDTNRSNWQSAYGWGNHTSAGYLTSYSETDPCYKSNTYATGMNQSVAINAEPNFGNANMHGNISRFTNDSGYLTTCGEGESITLINDTAGIGDVNSLTFTNGRLTSHTTKE